MFAEFWLSWEQRIYVILTVFFPSSLFSLKVTMGTYLFSSNFSVHPSGM